jgi:hypothetical protein
MDDVDRRFGGLSEAYDPGDRHLLGEDRPARRVSLGSRLSEGEEALCKVSDDASVFAVDQRQHTELTGKAHSSQVLGRAAVEVAQDHEYLDARVAALRELRQLVEHGGRRIEQNRMQDEIDQGCPLRFFGGASHEVEQALARPRESDIANRRDPPCHSGAGATLEIAGPPHLSAFGKGGRGKVDVHVDAPRQRKFVAGVELPIGREVTTDLRDPTVSDADIGSVTAGSGGDHTSTNCQVYALHGIHQLPPSESHHDALEIVPPASVILTSSQ